MRRNLISSTPHPKMGSTKLKEFVMLVITSEQRVGSRWIGYLLGDMLTGQKPTPEINLFKDTQSPILVYQEIMNKGKILKLHGNTPTELIHELGSDIKLLGIVRDPRDRLLSLSFHKRYHPYHDGFNEKKRETELEALQYTVVDDPTDNRINYRMLEYMIPGFSTKSPTNLKTNYVWTTYEWLKEDTYEEITRILDALDIGYIADRVVEYIEKYSFKNMTGRKPGEEDRKNTFARKGVTGDWKNWFTPEMIRVTEEVYQEYYRRVQTELDKET